MTTPAKYKSKHAPIGGTLNSHKKVRGGEYELRRLGTGDKVREGINTGVVTQRDGNVSNGRSGATTVKWRNKRLGTQTYEWDKYATMKLVWEGEI